MSENPRTDMPNLLELVRREVGAGGGDEIYVDIHGGPRATQQLLINLLSVLEYEGIIIEPENILTVDGPNKPIIQVGEGFKINDFISGIHEFVNYGRMESLNRFYEKNPSNASAGLRAVMQDLSTAIQMCAMGWFDRLLGRLAEELNNFREGAEEDYLKTFIDLIARGYEGLIKKEKAQSQILWDLGFLT